MAQNSADEKLYSGLQHYHYELLDWQRKQRGWSIQEVARRTGEHFQTVRQVFKGNATNRKVFPVANLLNLDWAQVHNLSLEEEDFHLAVLNGNGAAHSTE